MVKEIQPWELRYSIGNYTPKSYSMAVGIITKNGDRSTYDNEFRFIWILRLWTSQYVCRWDKVVYKYKSWSKWV